MIQTPALYRVRTVHERRDSYARRFAYGFYLWLVDLDSLPRQPWPLGVIARFRTRDHLGDPDRSIRENVADLLAAHDIDHDGRILMLASPAFLGYTFNPISLFWCLDRNGDVQCIVVEVHNTYGGRHAYVIQPDQTGHATADKALYVSPFLGTDGHYSVRAPLPDDRLAVAVKLTRDGDRTALAASLTGERRPARLRELLRLVARFPFPTLRISALIRWQGILLYLRRVPRTPRPQWDKERV